MKKEKKIGGLALLDESDPSNPKILARAVFLRIDGRSDRYLAEKFEACLRRADPSLISGSSWELKAYPLDGRSEVSIGASGSEGSRGASLSHADIENAMRSAIRGIGARPLIRLGSDFGEWSEFIEEFIALDEALALKALCAKQSLARPAAKKSRRAAGL